MISIIKNKELFQITKEWDKIAPLREKQISSGADHSANKVLAPAILKEIPKNNNLIDIGCGTGWLTSRAALSSRSSIGIDPSQNSIKIALENYKNEKTFFSVSSIEDFLKEDRTFGVAISNMVASSAPNLEYFIHASRKVLELDGTFIMTIPHPCFWPIYWGYLNDKSFVYEQSCIIEGGFKIQSELTDCTTTHFHHPLEKYVNIINSQGFVIEGFTELRGKGFSLPRFLLIKARAV